MCKNIISLNYPAIRPDSRILNFLKSQISGIRLSGQITIRCFPTKNGNPGVGIGNRSRESGLGVGVGKQSLESDSKKLEHLRRSRESISKNLRPRSRSRCWESESKKLELWSWSREFGSESVRQRSRSWRLKPWRWRVGMEKTWTSEPKLGVGVAFVWTF